MSCKRYEVACNLYVNLSYTFKNLRHQHCISNLKPISFKANYFLISNYGNVAGFELSCERSFAKTFNWSQHSQFFFSFACFAFLVFLYSFISQRFQFTWQYAKCKAIRTKGNALWALFGCTPVIIFVYSLRIKWII